MGIREAVTYYSSRLGTDSMLIQGAGGNVSWKDGDTLWIKASGTWLSDAEGRDIFISLSLTKTRQLMESGSSELTAACLGSSDLRPSIETSLHALLPHSVVVHVHAVDIIARAVLKKAKAYFEERLAGLSWIWIDYAKPGPALANAIAEKLIGKAMPNILVLGNHGLVVAGSSVEQVDSLLQNVLLRCKADPRPFACVNHQALDQLVVEWAGTGYQLPENPSYHSLGLDTINLTLARDSWVMYPDHAVFLGERAIFKNHLSSVDFLLQLKYSPPCIFVAGKGMVVSDQLSRGQDAMIDCYLKVTSRLLSPLGVRALNAEEIAELLNWDAEKYRQIIN